MLISIQKVSTFRLAQADKNTLTEMNCFKVYDICGRVHEQLNADVALHIGCALAAERKGQAFVLGSDIRLEGPVSAQH